MSNERAERLVVVALCERLKKARELRRALAGLDIEYRSVVSRNGRPRWRFAAAVAVDVLRAPGLLGRLVSGECLLSDDLESPRTLRFLRTCGADVGLHATSVIYRRAVIEPFRLGILNPHIGLLPEYRGRSVMEWSVLRGDATGISTFFIDEGIDTGQEIVLRKTFDPSGFSDRASFKSFLFDQDAEMFRQALELLTDPGFAPQRQDPGDGRRWFVMSELFGRVVDGLLADTGAPGKPSGAIGSRD